MDMGLLTLYMLTVVHFIFALNKNEHVLAVFIDLSLAFNTIY